ncbi:hypothetical protein ACFZAU_39525 [Streptomyces sp. NPDC008238]
MPRWIPVIFFIGTLAGFVISSGLAGALVALPATAAMVLVSCYALRATRATGPGPARRLSGSRQRDRHPAWRASGEARQAAESVLVGFRRGPVGPATPEYREQQADRTGSGGWSL